MKVHPVADLFPLMDDQAFKELTDDIKQNGLRSPIIIHEGALLDGRNRKRVCDLIGIKPVYKDWEPKSEGDTPLKFILSTNLVRRHLTESQRAMIAADLANMPKYKHKADGSIDTSAQISQADAANRMNVSKSSVKRAAKVKKKSPELAERVREGKVPVSKAERIAKAPEDVQRKALKKIDDGKAPDVEESSKNPRTAFLSRVKAAIKSASYSGPVDDEVVGHAKRVAQEWSKLVDELEKRRGDTASNLNARPDRGR